ncbi:MAG: L,D-transpeptidase [Pseudomonadota bacterium]
MFGALLALLGVALTAAPAQAQGVYYYEPDYYDEPDPYYQPRAERWAARRAAQRRRARRARLRAERRFMREELQRQRRADRRRAERRRENRRRREARQRPERRVNREAPPRQVRRGKSPDIVDGGPKPRIAPVRPPIVRFTGYKRGEIVIDTAGRRLYYVLSRGRAYSYPVAVGKAGFQWFGTKRITRTAKWPDWRPPASMRKRKPHLPKLMTGGLWNPLGYKALYLGSSLYRIHGTANAQSIGQAASSGCFRMHNGHVEHLSRLVGVGAKVHVLRRLPRRIARLTRRLQ